MSYDIPSAFEQRHIHQEMYKADKKNEMDAARVKKEYADFISNSKKYFLSEALSFFLIPCLEKLGDVTPEIKAQAKLMCESFVIEEDPARLISKMERHSLLTAGIAEAVNSSQLKVVHSSNGTDPSTFKITKTIKDDFFDKLQGLTDEKMTEKIYDRVCKSIETYADANVADKKALDELADKTKEKIDNIKAKSQEEKEKIAHEFTMKYKKAVNDLKGKTNRRVGVFETMMNAATESCLKNASLLESHLNDDGKLDVSAIRESVTVMYTFLEMVNTMGVKDVNESYIASILKDM